MEQLDTEPYESLTAEAVKLIELPEHIRRSIPNAGLEIEIAPDAQPSETREFRCTIRWGSDATASGVTATFLAFLPNQQQRLSAMTLRRTSDVPTFCFRVHSPRPHVQD